MTRCLLPPQPVGTQACLPITRAWKLPTRQAVVARAVQVDQEPQQSPIPLASDAQQQQEPQQRPGLEMAQVQAQTTCQAVWSLLSSQPPGELSAEALGAAFHRTFELADLRQPEDRAVAVAVAELGWAHLEALFPGQLVRLLKLTAWCEACTPDRLHAWLVAFDAGNGLGALAPKSRVVLLEAARRLAVPGACWVPRRLLGSNLGRLCTPASLADHNRLGLRSLARIYSCARDLGFKLTAEQHQVLVGAARERLLAGQFSVKGVGELMQAWAAMERQFDQRELVAKVAAARATAAAKQLPPPPKLEQPSPQQQKQQQGLDRPGSNEGAARKDRSAVLGKIVSGYPGDDVLELVVDRVHAHRSQMGPWAIGQFIGALGVLRYAPPPQVLRDLLAEFEQGLVGAEQRREVTAALNGLARLGLDPGESFAEACMRVVVADAGRDQTLISNVARTLAMLQRCTPERWQVLVDLLSQGLACSGITAFADLRRNEWRPRLIMWLTAYLLMEEQYGSAAAEQGGGTAAQQGDAGEGNPAAAAGAAAAGPAAGQSSGAGAADSSVAAAELAAEQGAGAQVVPLPVALLPMEFLHCCVAEALETRRTAPAVFSHQHRMAAKVVRELFGSTLDLQDCYSILHPATGAPLVVDIALPELCFAVLLNRPRDTVRNTGTPLGSVCVAVRLARLCGWELVVLPREVLQPGSSSGSSTAGWELEDAIRVHLRRHATRLLHRPAAESSRVMT